MPKYICIANMYTYTHIRPFNKQFQYLMSIHLLHYRHKSSVNAKKRKKKYCVSRLWKYFIYTENLQNNIAIDSKAHFIFISTIWNSQLFQIPSNEKYQLKFILNIYWIKHWSIWTEKFCVAKYFHFVKSHAKMLLLASCALVLFVQWKQKINWYAN